MRDRLCLWLWELAELAMAALHAFFGLCDFAVNGMGIIWPDPPPPDDC